MSEPVIFLAFANQALNPLKELSEEDRVVYETFAQSSTAHHFTIHRDQHTTGKAIINMLRTFGNRLSLFHYGGHASNAQLYLTDQEARGQGLVQLLALQKNLKLVFLNGCNTSGFIKQLLDSGIPAVIATSRAVEDPIAVRLADEFYQSLVKGSSIKESFDFAKATIETSPGAISDRIALRGIRLPADASEDFPWGLYYQDAKALDWKLAEAVNDLSPMPSRFWIRIAALTLAIFALFAWGNMHFGRDNLAMYLTLGPLALITIGSTLLRIAGNKYRRINAQIGKPLHALLNFFLKPVTLGVLFLAVLALYTVFCSVCIDHSGKGPLKANLKSVEGNDIRHWRIGGNNPDHTRLLAMITPGKRKHTLGVENYEEKPVRYNLLGSAIISFDSLIANPAIIVRIPHLKLGNRTQYNITVLRNGEPFVDRKRFGDSGSILLGNERVEIPEHMIGDWKRSVPSSVADAIVGLWGKTSTDSINMPLHYGDTITVTLRQVDSVRLTKEFVIQPQILTDVLLN